MPGLGMGAVASLTTWVPAELVLSDCMHGCNHVFSLL
jgi:hypothetical protein